MSILIILRLSLHYLKDVNPGAEFDADSKYITKKLSACQFEKLLSIFWTKKYRKYLQEVFKNTFENYFYLSQITNQNLMHS
jgi:hypothetical protein